MTINKFTLLAAAAASAFGASAQAQQAFPAATIVGAGATLVQNVTRQMGDCYGVKNNLGFGANSGTVQSSIALADFDFNTPAADTLGNRFDCSVRDVQPNITTRYLSTGSGQGILAFLANRITFTTPVISAGFPAYTQADGYQYSFSETALSSANLVTYNTAIINPFNQYSGTTNTAASLFGPAIQVPTVLAIVAVGYAPVYAKVRAGDGSVTSYSFKVGSPRADGSGGLRLTRAQYCGIFNGTITNWNQLPTTVVNKDPNDPAAFNVPIRLVGRSETSGTTSVYTRAMAAQCNGISVATGVGGTGTLTPVVNRFGESEARLPYAAAPTVAGTAYTGAASTLSPTNSLSGAFFDKGTGVITIGTEAAGLFTVANGNDGVALATAFHPDPTSTPGDRTLNGRVNYISAEQTLPATLFNGANTLGLHSASLQVNGVGTTFVAPKASEATKAFGTTQPPQSKGTSGAYCTDAAACPTAYGNRSNPLDWVQPSLKSASNAAPIKGYPIIGTSAALLYTCYATPERRIAVNGFFATNVGKTPRDSLNQAMPAAMFVDGVNGLLAKSGLGTLPLGWRNAIAETFFKSSLQIGTLGDTTTRLGLRNLWIQSRIPTLASTASLTNNTLQNATANPLCAGRPGA